MPWKKGKIKQMQWHVMAFNLPLCQQKDQIARGTLHSARKRSIQALFAHVKESLLRWFTLYRQKKNSCRRFYVKIKSEVISVKVLRILKLVRDRWKSSTNGTTQYFGKVSVLMTALFKLEKLTFSMLMRHALFQVSSRLNDVL